MSEKIINIIANSPLITLELKAFSPKLERVDIDIKKWISAGRK